MHYMSPNGTAGLERFHLWFKFFVFLETLSLVKNFIIVREKIINL